MEKEEETTRELLLPNWQGSGSHGLTIAQRDDGVYVQEVMQNSPAARTGVVKEGDQIVGATIYFDNLQSGEVTQLLNTMGHHTVGLKLHRKGDRSPEPGQTWTHEVFSSHSSEVVLNTPQPSALERKDQDTREEVTSQARAGSVSPSNADALSLNCHGGWKTEDGARAHVLHLLRHLALRPPLLPLRLPLPFLLLAAWPQAWLHPFLYLTFPVYNV
ncbi:neuroblast differentiation-associated protein AHNAK isoform X9 [Phacochoerus africanus]|uniref:neuroblast differentiation-associated protein AHNAK isoform X9 n=1 Tax=Phacochoerus africanus TaxID=41426 RepID=UPI001FDAB23B|nr:neuroblast differentiation-associated protein AHNAK isoform X9 [Phacochoerus africanus]